MGRSSEPDELTRVGSSPRGRMDPAHSRRTAVARGLARSARAAAVLVAAVAPSPAPAQGASLSGNVTMYANTGPDPLPVQGQPSLVPARNLLVTAVGVGTAYTDASGDFAIPYGGTGPVPVNVRFVGKHVGSIEIAKGASGTALNLTRMVTPGVPEPIVIYSPSSAIVDLVQSTAYWAVDDLAERVRVLFTDRFGSGSAKLQPLAAIDRIRIVVNHPLSGAGYVASRNLAHFSLEYAVAPNIQHEWGHAIDNAYGLRSSIELEEGWADTFGTYGSGQSYIAKGLRGERNAVNGRTYPSCIGSYQSGLTWMGWCWDVREGLKQKLGVAAGIARAEEIVLCSIVEDARDQIDAVRDVFLFDDDDGDLTNGTPSYDVLAAAAERRKLPYPVRARPTPGAVSYYGTGCAGSGAVPAECLSTAPNPNSMISFQTPASVNITYAAEVTAPTDLQVSGFEWRTRCAKCTTLPITLDTFLYDADPQSGAPANVLARGTMTVGAVDQFYRTSFGAPVPVGHGTTFFVAARSRTTNDVFILPDLVQRCVLAPYWEERAGAWTRNHKGAFVYKVLCQGAGNAIPGLDITRPPEIGRRYEAALYWASAAPASAVLLVGASNSSWGNLTLPLGLGPFGAPGCSVLASGEVTLPVTTDPLGNATVEITLPNESELVNARLYHQYVVLDGATGTTIESTTGGADLRIGRP